MGVFNCPDCGGIVSEHALTCPNCGCPFNRCSEPSPRIITLKRKRSFNGAAVKFDVVVDGTIRALIKNGESISLNVDGNNRHAIYVCIHQMLEKIGGTPLGGARAASSDVIEIDAGTSPLNFETTGGVFCKLYQI